MKLDRLWSDAGLPVLVVEEGNPDDSRLDTASRGSACCGHLLAPLEGAPLAQSEEGVSAGQPEPDNFPAFGDVWLTRHFYDTGVVLGQGESMHFQMVLEEPHSLLDLLVFENGDSGKPLLFRPAVYPYDCIVTGV
jgi:hypothetical protein